MSVPCLRLTIPGLTLTRPLHGPQVWLAANGLWLLVDHAFVPRCEQSGRLAGGALVNLAKNGANKPLMYRAELKLKSTVWRGAMMGEELIDLPAAERTPASRASLSRPKNTPREIHSGAAA